MCGGQTLFSTNVVIALIQSLFILYSSLLIGVFLFSLYSKLTAIARLAFLREIPLLSVYLHLSGFRRPSVQLCSPSMIISPASSLCSR